MRIETLKLSSKLGNTTVNYLSDFRANKPIWETLHRVPLRMTWRERPVACRRDNQTRRDFVHRWLKAFNRKFFLFRQIWRGHYQTTEGLVDCAIYINKLSPIDLYNSVCQLLANKPTYQMPSSAPSPVLWCSLTVSISDVHAKEWIGLCLLDNSA